MRLEADSLYALIAAWADMQMIVTEESISIKGNGFVYDIAKTFSSLVQNWEASILLPPGELDAKPGNYDLLLVSEGLYACRGKQKLLLKDGPVVVEVRSKEVA